MSQYVLLESGKVITIQNLRSLTEAEKENHSEKARRDKFDDAIKKLYGDSEAPPDGWVQRRRKTDDDGLRINDENREDYALKDVDDYSDFDAYIGAEVLLPQNGDVLKAARVIGRAVDDSGSSIGQYDSNPMLNTKVYDVMFPDGAVQQYAANVIAESLYENADDDGRRYQYMDEIIGHNKLDSAIKKEDGFIISKSGQKKHKATTKGWEFLIKWKDGIQSWVPMIEVKESYPVQLAEYAKLHQLEDEPAFVWWIAHALRKRDQIISSVKERVKNRTRNYQVP